MPVQRSLSAMLLFEGDVPMAAAPEVCRSGSGFPTVARRGTCSSATQLSTFVLWWHDTTPRLLR